MATYQAAAGFLSMFRRKPDASLPKATRIAFEVGEKVYARTNGATSDLKAAVMMHRKRVNTEA